MTKAEIFQQICDKKSYLCVGLDTDIEKIPSFLRKEKDPIFEFNRRIIDATVDLAIAYKPNLAFYETLGANGWEALQKTMDYLPKDVFQIADAKRGDIGNTSALYARAFFSNFNFDAVTVAPYMGEDSVAPFLSFEEKWVILLALTSNQGAMDFQNLSTPEGPLHQVVIEKSKHWGTEDNMMYVVGATRSEQLAAIRQQIPEHFLLVPGIGAQGGDLELTSKNGFNKSCGLIVNSSRGIIYASQDKYFEKEAKKAAAAIQAEMAIYLDKYLPV